MPSIPSTIQQDNLNKAHSDHLPSTDYKVVKTIARKLDSALKAEGRWMREHEKISDGVRAKGKACQYDELLAEKHKNDSTFKKWSANRFLDITDFDYHFFHRKHHSKTIRALLEIIASKINHVSEDGDDGYFKKLERNIGWTRYITPILLSLCPVVDNLVRCGLWSHAKNSRRCHKAQLCSLCHWNDVLKVLVYAFGAESGAFHSAQAWWFITCSFTTNSNNAKCVARDLLDDDFDYSPGNHSYEPYPVILGLDDDEAVDPDFGYDDARLLGLITQDALDGLYQSKIVDGYHYKLEGAFQINPGRANRVNLHGHCVANGSETNGEYIAERLFEWMGDGLAKHRNLLNQLYFPDVQVLRITSADLLERMIKYSEKIIPINVIVAEAMAQPEAKLSDGSWNLEFMRNLEIRLYELINEDIPNIFDAFRLDDHLFRVRRRKTIGNMTFNDRGTCIGTEPEWHKKMRRKNAANAKKARREKNKEEAKLKALGIALPKKKKYRRRLKKPRRLGRSLKSRPISTPPVLAQASTQYQPQPPDSS